MIRQVLMRQVLFGLVMLPLGGCDDHSMTQQSRYVTYGSARLFADNTEAQALPPGVVAQGDLDRAKAAATPPAVDAPLLQRGQQRYDIFCSPCHSLSGNGDGMIVRRGFPAPPSYHDARLRAAPAQHFFDVITNGYGVMYSYAARIEPRDRWAIVAYVRALQESENARLADMPDLRSKPP
jgi:mono/diheme cytochrome c family protein